MKNKKTENEAKKLYEECASVNECTGAFQKAHLDKEELAKFHRQFNGEEPLD